MPPLLVRLNLPGFRSPEPFRLANAPTSMAGLACAVLEEIGGFSKEELDGLRSNLDRVPLTLLGELCAGQLIELASDAQLETFLATADSPRGPAIIEVRPRDVAVQDMDEAEVASSPVRSTAPPLPVASTSVARSPDASGFAAGMPQGSPVAHGFVGHGKASPSQVRETSSTDEAWRNAQLAAAAPLPSHSQAQHFTMPPEHGSLAEQFGVSNDFSMLSQPSEIAKAAPTSTLGSNGPLPSTSSSQPLGTRIPSARKERARTPDSQRGGHIGSRLRGGSNSTPSLVSQRGGANAPFGGSSSGSAPSQPRVQAPQLDSSASGGISAAAATDNRSSAQIRAPSVSSSTTERPSSSRGKVHNRLYNDKDDRRRRLEEARLRRLQEEQDAIKKSALEALGRLPSPSRSSAGTAIYQSTSGHSSYRAPSPDRQPSPQPGSSRGSKDTSARLGGGSGAQTSPRPKPPLPERPSSAGSRSRGRRTDGQFGSHPAEASSTVSAAPNRSGLPASSLNSDEAVAVAAHSTTLMPHTGSPTHSMPDASSFASESIGLRVDGGGLQRDASLGTIGAEDSLYGDTMGSASAMGLNSSRVDSQGLRMLVHTQQQRIEFMEHAHQQALRQLQKCREELSTEQQRRFQEADKALRLEQLIGEMQVQRFEGDEQMQRRYDDWLQRTRTVLQAE